MIGCDVGTQSTKGVLVSAGGDTVATATVAYEFEVPAPGWAEQDPFHWIEATKEVVGRLAGEARGDITHIGVAAQVDGVVATDEDLGPLHPAIIWLDRRAGSQAASIDERLGDRVFPITGLNNDPSHAAPKMMWLRERLGIEPRWFLPPATVITSWLTGGVAQDEANASSTMLFDVKQRQWSDELLDATGLDPKRLPEVTTAADPIGVLKPDLAELLGVTPSAQVVAGSGDDHAAAVGAGAVRPGVVADVSGTAEPVGTTAVSPVLDAERLLETHAHAVADAWFVENPGFVSGGSVRWLASILGVSQAEVLALASDAAPGCKGLVFVPALSGAMSPRWDDRHRGSFTGATLDHGRAELCRSVIEGCAFALRDILDRLAAMGLPVDQVHVTGGGARSETWLRIKADVSQREVYPVGGEGAALGAAALAGVAAGWYRDLVEASGQLLQLGDRYLPDSGLASIYDEAYARYRAVFDAMEPVYRR